MNKKRLLSISISTLLIGCALVVNAQMTSPNYTIKSSVISGGGVPVQSATPMYKINGTIGQASPIMNPSVPPGSVNYLLNPGFWYTVYLNDLNCIFNSDMDEDIDGSDLAEFADDMPIDDGELTLFASEYGRTDCY